jgi:hypothetical protein
MAEEERGFWGNLFSRREDAPRDIPVDFFSLPMDANPERDEIVGEGDFGPVYQTVRGQRYQIRPTSTERSYESDPGTLDRVAEVGRGAIEGAVDSAISGATAPARAARGEDMTYGDALETAGMAQVGGAGFAAPEGSLRTFVAGTSPREGFSPAGETTLEALRRNYPAAEARDEAYQAYERPNRGGVDIEVYPERDMARTPQRPGDPSRGDLLYDPDRAVIENNPDYVDVNGQSIDISYTRALPSQGASRLSEIVEPQEGVIYRGMSAEEYQNAMRDGYFESRGDYNIGDGQRGLTFFSPNMDTAENYAASFTPFDYLPTPDRPAYVVAIRQPDDVNLDTQGEVGVPGRIPVTEIVDTYRGDVYAARPSDWHLQDDWGTPRLSGTRYSPQIAWNRVDANRDATTGIMATQAGRGLADEAANPRTPNDFGFYQDNPALKRSSGVEWLENKQRVADERYAESRGITGSTTATLGSGKTDMFLPTDFLRRIPGLNRENRRPGDSRYDDLLRDVQRRGFLPDQDGNKVVLGINHRGEPFLIEGNTRVAVANDVGVPNVRVEVIYKNGGEMVDGPFSPENVARIAASEPLTAAQPQEFNRGGLVRSDATKGIRTKEGMDMAMKKFQLDRSKADRDGDGEVSPLEAIQGEAAQRTVGKDDLVEMACGGIMMPEMEYDPVSGNEVPLGSTPENVRDDIPAMLSQDEYVLPAHVVKWHGLKHIQEMQMEAEAGLMAMQFEGLIGGQPVEDDTLSAEEKYNQLVGHTEDAGMEVTVEDGEVQVEDPDEDFTQDEYIDEMDVEVDIPTVEVEDELDGEEYEEEPLTSTLPGMMKKQKYAFIIS